MGQILCKCIYKNVQTTILYAEKIMWNIILKKKRTLAINEQRIRKITIKKWYCVCNKSCTKNSNIQLLKLKTSNKKTHTHTPWSSSMSVFVYPRMGIFKQQQHHHHQKPKYYISLLILLLAVIECITSRKYSLYSQNCFCLLTFSYNKQLYYFPSLPLLIFAVLSFDLCWHWVLVYSIFLICTLWPVRRKPLK